MAKIRRASCEVKTEKLKLDDFVIQSEARNLHFRWVPRPSALRVRVFLVLCPLASLLARRQEILRVQLQPLARRL